MKLSSTALLAGLIFAAVSGNARAQDDLSRMPAARDFMSPERFVVELRGGPYSPDFDRNRSFSRFYGGDSGPFLGFQLSYILYRIPDVAYFTAGGGFGWVNFSGGAVAEETGETVSEETTLTLLPLSALGSVRIDVLPRMLKFPFIFAGKLGFQWVHWDTDTGARNDASGWSLGLLYGAQLALDLDTFEPAAARSMDEEWGINHSFVFFEFYGFAPTEKSLEVGDQTWLLGLGFNF